MKLLDKLQPAVKQESKKVILYTCIGTIVMWAVWLGLHMAFPEKVGFDYTVILGGVGGGLMAVADFVWMGLTLQKAVSLEDEDMAKQMVRAGYTKRSMARILWVAVAIMTPVFHYIAGIIPLVFPGTGIKIAGVIAAFGKKENKEVM